MNRVLILGGAGFLGRNLQEALGAAGHSVAVVDHAGRAASEGHHCLALTDQDRLFDLMREQGTEVVVHLTCGLLPSSDADDFAHEQRAIIEPSFRLMEQCARLGIRFVLFSSGGTVYGESHGERVREDHLLAPKNYYGLSKVMLESYAQLCQRMHGLRYLLLRPSNPYGRHQRLQGAQGLIAVALGNMLSGRALQVWGDGSAVRDYLDVGDLAAAVVSLIDRGVVDRTFNIGSGVGHSLNEVLAMLREVTGRALPVQYHAARSVDVQSIVLDTSALAAVIPWQPRPLRLGLADFWRSLGELHEH
jgi:UDP-glucose 4-epimerase